MHWINFWKKVLVQVKSQIIGIKFRVDKEDYTIQFSIKFREGNNLNSNFNINKILFSLKETSHKMASQNAMLIVIYFRQEVVISVPST